MRGLRAVVRRAALLWVVLAALTAPAEARRLHIPVFHRAAERPADDRSTPLPAIGAGLAAAKWSGAGLTARSPGDAAAEPKPQGTRGLPVLMLVSAVAFVLTLRRRVPRAAKLVALLIRPRNDGAGRRTDLAGPGFEARIAARLAEMKRDEADAATALPVRTFGRRAA